MSVTIDQFQFCRRLENSGKVLKIKFVDYFEKYKILGKISLVSAVRVQHLMHSYM